MKTNISDIPNDILARLFFRRLWQGYDSGGFSVGRSLQSNLVEAYMSLNQYENLEELSLGLRGFAQEADTRAPNICRQTLLGNLDNLSLISSYDLSLLCIDALRVWYQIHKDEKHSQGYVANTWEGKFVTSLCRIMPIPIFPYFSSDEDIVRVWVEVENRIRIKNKVDIDHFYD